MNASQFCFDLCCLQKPENEIGENYICTFQLKPTENNPYQCNGVSLLALSPYRFFLFFSVSTVTEIIVAKYVGSPVKLGH